MNRRPALLVAAAIVLGGLLLGLRPGRAAPGQADEPARPSGRYQAAIAGGNITYVVVIDSATGRCWTHTAAGGKWMDLGTPPTEKK